MPDDDLEVRLRRVVARIRLPVDDRCHALFDALIAIGVARVEAVGDEASHRDEAVDAFRRIVDDLTQQARILRVDALPAPSLVAAIERLRPLWPFC